MPITLPPLRERRRDIPKIAARYLRRAGGKEAWELDDGAEKLLMSPSLKWAGNIRELEAVLERARNRAAAENADPIVEARHLGLDGAGSDKAPVSSPPVANQDDILGRWQELGDQKANLDQLEKSIIEDTLRACGGTVARAARMLSVPRTGLISRMATLEINPQQFKNR